MGMFCVPDPRQLGVASDMLYIFGQGPGNLSIFGVGLSSKDLDRQLRVAWCHGGSSQYIFEITCLKMN